MMGSCRFLCLIAAFCLAASLLGQEADDTARVLLRLESRASLNGIDASALAVDPYGRIYVTDKGKNRLLRLDTDFQPAEEIGGYGWDREQFDGPVDVCAANGLDVYVCDLNNHRIERYDKDLNYISSLSGRDLSPPWSFGYPMSVAQAPHGDLFIAERENRRVLRLDGFGQPRLSFGDLDSGPGQLAEPLKLELIGTEKVVVLDSVDRRLAVFDFFGNFLGSWGQGVLRRPVALACRPDGLILVADRKLGIVAFRDGQRLPLGMLPSEAISPVDLSIHGDSLYLLDGNAPRILRYRVLLPKEK